MKKVIISIIFAILIIIPNYEVKAANSLSCSIDLTEYTFANSKVTRDSSTNIKITITLDNDKVTISTIDTFIYGGVGYSNYIYDGGISSKDFLNSEGKLTCPTFYYTMTNETGYLLLSDPYDLSKYTIYTKSSPEKPDSAAESSTSGFVTDSVTNTKTTYKEWLTLNNGEDDDDEPDVIENACEIFGGETTTIIKYVLLLIRIGVPVLIVILTMLDFTKIILNAEDKEYKAAISKLIKRIGVAVAIVILPMILTLIIEISGVLEQYGIADGDLFCSLF